MKWAELNLKYDVTLIFTILFATIYMQQKKNPQDYNAYDLVADIILENLPLNNHRASVIAQSIMHNDE